MGAFGTEEIGKYISEKTGMKVLLKPYTICFNCIFTFAFVFGSAFLTSFFLLLETGCFLPQNTLIQKKLLVVI